MKPTVIFILSKLIYKGTKVNTPKEVFLSFIIMRVSIAQIRKESENGK